MATLRAKVDSFQDSGKLLEWAEALEIHQDPIVLDRLAILRSVSSPVTAPDAPRAAEWWDDSFDATDEALLLDSDNCKFFGFLFL